MSPLAAYPNVVVSALGLIALVEMIVALYALVESCVLGQGRAWIAGAGACVAAIVSLAWSLAVVSHLRSKPWLHVPVLPALLAQTPLVLAVLLLVLMGGAEAYYALRLRRVRLGRITPDSVKEALDALPDGVCFSGLDGRPVLVNARMDLLAHDALGMAVSDEADLWERLREGACRPGYTVERLGEHGDAALLLTAPDGRAWEFRRQNLAVEGGIVVETVATDVTEERALAIELAQRNDHLAAVNRRLRSFGADLTRLTREEEVLAAKVRVHDEVGRALVALRAYERQQPEERDRAVLLAQWRGIANLLQTAAAEEVKPDAWEQLVQAAQAVDVQIECEGSLPEDEQTYELVVALVHECLNNAVRHAEAHVLAVRLAREGTTLTVHITNDGAVPEGPVKATGGLANLTELVRRAGGRMEVRWKPRFAVVAHLKLEES